MWQQKNYYDSRSAALANEKTKKVYLTESEIKEIDHEIKLVPYKKAAVIEEHVLPFSSFFWLKKKRMREPSAVL